MASEKDRSDGLAKLIAAHPDWDWDYWMAQTEG